MYVEFNTRNDFLVVRLIGELDHHSAEEVRSRIDDKIERESIKKIIMDFKNVTFMDSSGIGVVIGRYKKVAGIGGSISIACATDNIKRVFELSGIFRIIKYYEKIDDAVKSV